ncbi:MAG: hypothetical protein L3K02_04775, partial [Thermoplasmata archaeon]|nr:hypothetical protein [Thermoplasmata archaeon]
MSATKLDLNQPLTVSSNLPTTGTGPYSWAWLVSVNDGAYTNAVQCGTMSGSGGLGGATEHCVIAPNTLTKGDKYNFRLSVTDSATAAESSLSHASSTVVVKAA